MGIWDYVSDLYDSLIVQEAEAEEPQKDDEGKLVRRNTDGIMSGILARCCALRSMVFQNGKSYECDADTYT